jgi:hypothetical protein
MPLRPENCRTFTRRLYAGILEKVELLKREDNQRQGIVRSLIIYDCRRGQITKTGETIQGDVSSDHRATWHIPLRELQRVGVAYLNPLDRIVDKNGFWWEPEGTTSILQKLMLVEIDIDCLRVDPPRRSG